MEFSYKRQHARAPLSTFVLYSDDDFVFKAKLLNISEGGILVENFPHLPSRDHVPFLFDLPDVPELTSLHDDDIFTINKSDLKRDFVRVIAQAVRRVGDTTNVDDMFIQVGCQFINLQDQDREKIHSYVEKFKSNLVFLINLMENRNDEIDDKRILKIADLLGYGKIKSLMLLHKTLVTDSASLFQT